MIHAGAWVVESARRSLLQMTRFTSKGGAALEHIPNSRADWLV